MTVDSVHSKVYVQLATDHLDNIRDMFNKSQSFDVMSYF